MPYILAIKYGVNLEYPHAGYMRQKVWAIASIYSLNLLLKIRLFDYLHCCV